MIRPVVPGRSRACEIVESDRPLRRRLARRSPGDRWRRSVGTKPEGRGWDRVGCARAGPMSRKGRLTHRLRRGKRLGRDRGAGGRPDAWAMVGGGVAITRGHVRRTMRKVQRAPHLAIRGAVARSAAGRCRRTREMRIRRGRGRASQFRAILSRRNPGRRRCSPILPRRCRDCFPERRRRGAGVLRCRSGGRGRRRERAACAASAQDIADRRRRAVISSGDTGQCLARFVSGYDRRPILLWDFPPFTGSFHGWAPWVPIFVFQLSMV